MKVIEYRVHFTGATANAARSDFRSYGRNPEIETVRVQARDINAGFVKALKVAREPLGSGTVREIGRVEFWQVV